MIKNACQNPLISIIIPIYNTKDYLKRCLQSVCSQTYRWLEIICVDDGSTDGSEIILDQFAERDKRIRVVHKKNGGESSARNIGLRMMSGAYVGFIDCDDWIEADMYETLVSAMVSNRVDIAASAWYKDTDIVSEKIQNQLPIIEGTFDREALLNYIYKRDYYRGFTYMWNKLYHRSLFYDEKGKLILFDEDLELGGDVLYLGRLALNAANALYIDRAFYHYYQRDGSGCHTENLKKREDWLEAYKRLVDYIEKNRIETQALIWIKRFLAYHSSNVAEMAYQQGNDLVLKRCQEIMRQYEKEYSETNKGIGGRIERYFSIMNLDVCSEPPI